MAKTNIHVTKTSNGWEGKKEGNKTPSVTGSTKAEVIKEATKIAKQDKSELVIHNIDGKISNKNSFGNDPNPPRDTK